MKKNILFIVLLFMSLNMSIVAQDKFHVFLCFGQSNMEGHAKIEAQDTYLYRWSFHDVANG